MDNNIGFKELYEVSLKATYPIEINGRIVEIGENIAVFDKILISTFEEKKDIVSANGGIGNAALIWWEDTKEMRIQFAQGVFSKQQLALMTGAKMVHKFQEALLVSKREFTEIDGNGRCQIEKTPVGQVFIYDKETGSKIVDFAQIDNNITFYGITYREIIIDYQYNFYGNYEILTVGQNITGGYLSLEGKTRVKDDITGQVTTGIIKIPKLKLLSNLSMRLGKDAVPLVGRLDAVAVPDGERGRKKVMEIIFLDEDIDSDI